MIKAARTPGTLLAATQAPTPLPQMAKTPVDLTTGHRPGQGHHKIRVVISGFQLMGTEVRHLISGGLEGRSQLHFQLKPTMICSNANTHYFSSFFFRVIVCMVTNLLGGDRFHAGWSVLTWFHFQFRISGMSWPCLSMYCLCSMSLSCTICFR